MLIGRLPSAKAADAVFTDPKTPVADRTNMLYSGCFVTAGNGRAVVTAVGDDTEFGKIARELRAANTGMTPLQEKLAKLGKVIAVVGSIVAALVFVLQVARFVASGTASFDTISEAFITLQRWIVAAVPEGLPTIVAACPRGEHHQKCPSRTRWSRRWWRARPSAAST